MQGTKMGFFLTVTLVTFNTSFFRRTPDFDQDSIGTKTLRNDTKLGWYH